MTSDTIESIHKQTGLIVEFLASKGETTFQVTADETFRKSMILGAASYFESKIVFEIETLVTSNCDNKELVLEFVRAKGLKRKYHLLFDWDRPSANHFFATFGKRFVEFMKDKIANDATLSESIRDFMKLGKLRNDLVHGNFALYSLTLTSEELLALYKSANVFVDSLSSLFIEFNEAGATETTVDASPG
ncbi:MAG: hypothetical protein IIB00_01805 [candidate division Zixibacteria bacterium]|nr:hypothetical protein [candidate division Zixibacteria bacterium]